MKTLNDLETQAREDIANDVDYIYDIAADQSQQVANVKHMSWFVKLVMLEIASTQDDFRHLVSTL